jgi:hypothetical protein
MVLFVPALTEKFRRGVAAPGRLEVDRRRTSVYMEVPNVRDTERPDAYSSRIRHHERSARCTRELDDIARRARVDHRQDVGGPPRGLC